MKKFKVNGKIIEANTILDAISKCKDAYIYTDLGQDYSNNIKDLKRKGLTVQTLGRASGGGIYIKIIGTRQQLEDLQDKGYFIDEIIHDSCKDDYNQFNKGDKVTYVDRFLRPVKAEVIEDLGTHLLVKNEDKWYGETSKVRKSQVRGGMTNDSDLEKLSKEEEDAVASYKKAIEGTNSLKLIELYKHILEEEEEHLRELQEAEVNDSIKDEDNTMIKGIIFKSDAFITNGRFTDFIDSYVVKLDDNIYLYYWHDGTSHISKFNELSKFKPYDEEYFSTSNIGGNFDIAGFNTIRKYSQFKNDIIAKAKKYFRV